MTQRVDIERMIEEMKVQVDAKLAKTQKEILELRDMIRENRITDEEASARIDYLETKFQELSAEVQGVTKEVAKMNILVASFSPKLDRFFDNLWKVVFALLAIVAGLVGIKLW